MDKGKVAIIGGGVAGLCSAYYLNARGYDVTVFEQGKFDQGCSLGNAGMIVPSHFVPLAQPGMIAKGIRWMFDSESPFYIRPRLSWGLLDWGLKFYRSSSKIHVNNSVRLLADLNLESRELYSSLAEELGDFGLQKKGLIMLCRTQRGFEEEKELAGMAHRLNMKAEILNPEQLSALDPGIRMNVVGGVYFPEDAFFTPDLFMKLLVNKLKVTGVRLYEDKRVDDIEVNGNRIKSLKVNNQMHEADEFIIAGGSWSGIMAKRAGIKIPLLAGKGYSFTVKEPVETPEICAILTEAKVAVTPMKGGLRFAGTMEIGGLDDRINEHRTRGIKKSVTEYYPEFMLSDFDDVDIWHGFRPVSPDGLPYIGRAGKYSNLIIATGHGMMGMSMGPVTGKLVSELMTGDRMSMDIGKLSVNRFN